MNQPRTNKYLFKHTDEEKKMLQELSVYHKGKRKALSVGLDKAYKSYKRKLNKKQ